MQPAITIFLVAGVAVVFMRATGIYSSTSQGGQIRGLERVAGLMKALIADDQEVVRKGVCSILESRGNFEVCGEVKKMAKKPSTKPRN
jgi:hypothetical protein